MIFRYTGQMTDCIAYRDSVIYLNPDSEVELADELTEFPYFARLIQSGVLKAVSKVLKQEDAEAQAPEPAPAESEALAVATEPAAEAIPAAVAVESVPATGAGTGSKTAPAPVTVTEDLK